MHISEKVAASLQQIVERARKVDALVAEIATASHEQNQGVGQINTAIAQMDKVTQSTAAGAEESAVAAEELSAQAAAMQESVQTLERLVSGQRANGGERGREEQQLQPAMVAPAQISRRSRSDQARQPAPLDLPKPVSARLAPAPVATSSDGAFFQNS